MYKPSPAEAIQRPAGFENPIAFTQFVWAEIDLSHAEEQPAGTS
jgi:hypothetical protein